LGPIIKLKIRESSIIIFSKMLPDTLGNSQSMIFTKNKRDEFLIEIRKNKNSDRINQKRIKMFGELEKTNGILNLQEEKNSFQTNMEQFMSSNTSNEINQEEQPLSQKVFSLNLLKIIFLSCKMN